MEIRSFSIDELKKKAVEIRLSILNSLAGADTVHIGAEPCYSFELGSREELHEKVGIGHQSVLKQIYDFIHHKKEPPNKWLKNLNRELLEN